MAMTLLTKAGKSPKRCGNCRHLMRELSGETVCRAGAKRSQSILVSTKKPACKYWTPDN